jgi:hypothetical protein
MDSGITYTGPSGGGALCAPGTLSIPATVHFVTADGGFDETWEESLWSNDGTSLTFTHMLGNTHLVGSFRVAYTGTIMWSSTETVLTATFNSEGASGTIQYATEAQSSAGPNSVSGGGLIVKAASWVPEVSDGGSAGAPDATVDGPVAD